MNAEASAPPATMLKMVSGSTKALVKASACRLRPKVEANNVVRSSPSTRLSSSAVLTITVARARWRWPHRTDGSLGDACAARHAHAGAPCAIARAQRYDGGEASGPGQV